MRFAFPQIGLVMVLNIAGALLGAIQAGAQTGTASLKAAADRVDITPTQPAYIAGYGQNRRSLDAHDPLSARCLVLESGKTRIALVSCDLIGIPRYEGQKIRARVKSVQADRVYLGATHTHSGPDTVGQWGPDLTTRGVDPVWMESFREKVAGLIDRTAAKLRPADLSFASRPDAAGISKNSRVPRILDTELAVMRVTGYGDGKTIATLVNFACHPEILNNRHMTADFPHWLYETVEKAVGGTCLYFNGAQGGMVTADFDESSAAKGQNWAAAETLGKRLGEYVLEALKAAEHATDTGIATQQRIFNVPLENKMFRTLIRLHVFPGDALVNEGIETEVNRLKIGPAEFLTIPGEALPNVGFYLKRNMTGKPKFLLGLTCDFLGYILTPEDYGLKLYEYETGVSVGPEIEPRMVRNMLEILGEK